MEYLVDSNGRGTCTSDRRRSRRQGAAIAIAVLLVAIAVMVLAQAQTARAADPTLPISKVQPGMVGEAKTVATGTAVTTFTVEVIGVLTNENYPGGDLILFRASGDLIDQTRGIVAGMSGSPIYLPDPDDGGQLKVAGAISYGYEIVDAEIALATPIGEMLDLFDLGGMSPLLPGGPATYVPRDGKPIYFGGGRMLSSALTESRSKANLAAGTVVLNKLAPIVSVQGMSPSSRGFAKLRTEFARRGFTLAAVPSGGVARGLGDTATIEPGASLAAGLMTGDTTVAGVGTATYVDGTRVLGWGHSFLWQGASDFPMMTGYVHTIMPGDLGGYGFKLASAAATTGTVVQDRSKGIGGKLGQTPVETTLTVEAENSDESTSVSKEFHLAKGVMSDWILAAIFADSAILTSQDDALDRITPGTAETTFSISGRTESGHDFDLDFDNMLYDSTDVSWMADMDLFGALIDLLTNPYEKVTIQDISYSAAMTATRKTARVVGASLLGRRVTAGTTMTVRVFVIPFGSDTTQTVETTIAVPAGMPASAELVVMTVGSMSEDVPLAVEGKSRPVPAGRGAISANGGSGSLQDWIDEFEAQQRRNELLIMLSGSDSYMPGPYMSVTGGDGVSKKVATDWVLSGTVMKSTSSVSMAPSSSAVVYPGSVGFSGRVTDLSDPYHIMSFDSSPTVELWMTPYGSTEGTVIATGVANRRTGLYSISYAPTTTATYQAHFIGDDSMLDASSTARTVNVKASVTLAASRALLRLGGTVVLSGGVRPIHSGNVYIQRLVGTRWVNISTRLLDANSNHTWTWKPSRRGVYLLRAYWPGDGSHKANVSRIRTVRVT